MKYISAKVIDAGSMTGTSVITSAVTDTTSCPYISYQMAWTGTPVGTFSFEVSNNYTNRNGTEAGDWTVLTLASAPTNPAGTATSTGVDLSGLGYRYVRMKYTNTSSTGTLNGYLFGKGEG